MVSFQLPNISDTLTLLKTLYNDEEKLFQTLRYSFSRFYTCLAYRKSNYLIIWTFWSLCWYVLTYNIDNSFLSSNWFDIPCFFYRCMYWLFCSVWIFWRRHDMSSRRPLHSGCGVLPVHHIPVKKICYLIVNCHIKWCDCIILVKRLNNDINMSDKYIQLNYAMN